MSQSLATVPASRRLHATSFSIVITTYNRLTLLKRAIARSLEQTTACEVVVVDDCSQDGTETYVSELSAQLQAAGDRRLVYHRNPTNQGHSRSVNVGVERASGDWIKALDDDDYLALDCIEVMGAAIALRPQAAICSCQAAQVDESERQLSLTDRVGPGDVCYVPQEDVHRGMLLEQVPFGTPVQVAFRRDAFLRSGGWDSSLDANFDDIDSWVKIAQFGDALFINRCLAYRTIWPGAYNQRFSLAKRLDTHMTVKRRIHALVPSQHRGEIPSLRDMEYYLKLHWAIVALKQGAWPEAVRFSVRAAFSPTAWYLLLQRRRHRSRVAAREKCQNSAAASAIFSPQCQRLFYHYLALRSGWRALRAGRWRAARRSALTACRSQSFWRVLALAVLPFPQQPVAFRRTPDRRNQRLGDQLARFVDRPARQSLANSRELRLYIQLRLACAAWKGQQWDNLRRFGGPLLLKPHAWWLALKMLRWRYQHSPLDTHVRKVMLSDFSHF